MEQKEDKIPDPSDAIGYTEALGEHATFPPTPSTSGDTLYSVDKKWKVSADETRIKGQFEQWVRGNARAAISEADTLQLPEEAAMMRSAYTADFAAGFYGWEGRHVRSARGDIPGLKQLLYLMLLRCHPENHPQPITPVIVDEMFDENVTNCLTAVMWSLGNFQSSVRRKAKLKSPPRTTKTEPPSLDG